jgi:GT2 family glycosyltransferase
LSNLTIIILNWNRPELTLRCLDSYSNLEGGPFNRIVVDNGSTDNSRIIIERACREIEVISLPDNLGYAEGNNRGIQRALENGAEFILISNNDVLASNPKLLSLLISAMEENPQAGIAGPKVLIPEPERLLFSRGSFVLWNKGELYHRDMFKPEAESPVYEEVESVDFIVGCCLLLRRSFIECVGLFDAEYYLNYEDVDLGVRAHRKGFDVIYVPKAVVSHQISSTLGVASPANTYYMTRNALRFFWLNSKPHLRYTTTSKILLRTLRTIIAWSYWNAYKNETFERKRKANVFAIRDFFMGRFGKMGSDVEKICYP